MNPGSKKSSNLPTEENKGSENPPITQNLQFQEMSSEQSSKTLGS
jgi:hypothetical protein